MLQVGPGPVMGRLGRSPDAVRTPYPLPPNQNRLAHLQAQNVYWPPTMRESPGAADGGGGLFLPFRKMFQFVDLSVKHRLPITGFIYHVPTKVERFKG